MGREITGIASNFLQLGSEEIDIGDAIGVRARALDVGCGFSSPVAVGFGRGM